MKMEKREEEKRIMIVEDWKRTNIFLSVFLSVGMLLWGIRNFYDKKNAYRFIGFFNWEKGILIRSKKC